MREVRHIEQLSLVAAIQANDEQALKKLYTENFKKVETFILMNNGSPSQAKDTYQEAFIAVWRNVKDGKFHPENESALQGYLFRIARNKWTDFLRSSRYKKTASLPQQLEREDDNGSDTPQRKQEQLGKVMEAFGQLGLPCKELLTEFYFGKKSVREIASSLNIEEASARNKKYRCMQKLKELALSIS